MALGVLADVEPDQREAERGEPAEEIGKPAVRDDLLPGLDQRAIAERQRFDDLVGRLEGVAIDQPVVEGFRRRGGP